MQTSVLLSKIKTFSQRVNWKATILFQLMLGQGIGWWWCIDKWNFESTYHISVPGIGTVSLLLGFHLIASFAAVFIAWAIEYKNMRSMQFFHIEHVYKDGEEPRYGVDGAEVEDDLDAEDLDREKWFGKPYDPEYINIDRQDLELMFQSENTENAKILDKEQITKGLEKYMPYVGPDPNWPKDSTKPAPIIKLPAEKSRDRIELGHEPAGLPAYFYYVTYNRKAYHAPVGDKDATPQGFIDCIEILHVPWDREFRFKRRTIPGKGFNVKCPFTERKELAHVDTVLGDLMVFQVTTSHYVRKEATRKIRPSDDVLASGLLKIVTFFYNIRKNSVRPLEDTIDNLRAEAVGYDRAVKNARLDVLARMNMRRYQAQRETQLNKDQNKQPTSSVPEALAWVFGIALVVMVLLIIFKVI